MYVYKFAISLTCTVIYYSYLIHILHTYSEKESNPQPWSRKPSHCTQLARRWGNKKQNKLTCSIKHYKCRRGRGYHIKEVSIISQDHVDSETSILVAFHRLRWTIHLTLDERYEVCFLYEKIKNYLHLLY